jgi:WD40 repeat protein
MLVLTGHARRIRHLAFAPDGATLASCADGDSRVWLWDLASRMCRGWLSGHLARVECLAFAPTGDRLASADDAGTVGLWNLASQKAMWLKSVSGRHGLSSPHCLSFSPDGRTLATAGVIRRFLGLMRAHGVRRWDTARGREQLALTRHAGRVLAVAHAPDGRTLAAGDAARVVKLWDVASGAEVASLPQRAAASGVAFTPNGRILAVIAGWSVVLWDVAQHQEWSRLQGHKGRIWSLALSPDGCLLATASSDGTVRLWDLPAGRERGGFDWKIGKVYAVAFAPDGMRAAAGGETQIVVWDVD